MGAVDLDSWYVGIDAAYDVVIDDASTVLNIYTDKYSNYTEENSNSNSKYFK